MISRITSEQDLLECFRPSERGEVLLPEELSFPFAIQGYKAWVEPSGHRVYLVFRDPVSGKNLGIVFRRDQQGPPAPAMCEWCHSVRSGSGVTLLTARSSANRRVGVNLCRDLSCREKALSDSPGVDDVPGTLSGPAKVRQMIARMSEFARKQIF